MSSIYEAPTIHLSLINASQPQFSALQKRRLSHKTKAMAFTVIRPTLHLIVLVLALLDNLYDEGVGGTGFTDEELDQQLKILNKPLCKELQGTPSS